MKPAPQLQTVTPARLLFLVPLLLLAAVAPAPAIAADKIPDSAWQTGSLRDVTNSTQSRVMGYNGMIDTQIRIVWQYTIDGGQYIYEADRTTRRREKPLNVTINGPVKFAVMGMDLYLRDDEGKVHKLAIATKTLKTENGNSK